jgi:predicted acylesterase/phospholipase RssA
MTIKHLVISGGGQTLVQYISLLHYLDEHQYLSMQNIESIYGTSAGVLVGCMVSMKFDWNTIEDFVILRPWHDIFKLQLDKVFDAYRDRGLYGRKQLEKMFKPLLDATDLSLNVTLQEFYDFTHKEMHFITFEVNEFQTVDISYLTHPDLSLLEAVQMSCGLPIIVTPVIKDNKCYMDGGMTCNYPLKYCLSSGKPVEEILGIRNKYETANFMNGITTRIVHEKSNLLEYVLHILFKLIALLRDREATTSTPSIPHEVHVDAMEMTFETLRQFVFQMDVRKELYKSGQETGRLFLESLQQQQQQQTPKEPCLEIAPSLPL